MKKSTSHIVQKLIVGSLCLTLGAAPVFANPPGPRANHFAPGPGGGPQHGGILRTLPSGFETLVIAGITYFLVAGTYYRQTDAGYVVVEAPPRVVQPQPTVPAVAVSSLVAVDPPLLNVRSGPGTANSVIFQVRQGERLLVEATANGWFLIRMNDGRTGWVMSGYTHPLAPDAKG